MIASFRFTVFTDCLWLKQTFAMNREIYLFRSLARLLGVGRRLIALLLLTKGANKRLSTVLVHMCIMPQSELFLICAYGCINTTPLH